MRSSISRPAGSEHAPRPDAGKPPLFRTEGARLSSLFLGMLAIALDQQTSYFIVPWSCGRGLHWPSHLISVGALLLALLGCYVGWRDLRRVPPETSSGDDAPDSRNQFLARLGLMLSAFFALVILTEWLAKFFFDPCQR